MRCTDTKLNSSYKSCSVFVFTHAETPLKMQGKKYGQRSQWHTHVLKFSRFCDFQCEPSQPQFVVFSNSFHCLVICAA